MTQQENTEKGFVRLTPDEGRLYDGEAVIATEVCCPKGTEGRWTEVSLDEAETIAATLLEDTQKGEMHTGEDITGATPLE
ncbi:MAG: hypothetical protein LUI09_06125 [Prevotellaceae bacterium]|nr:hypothetical protein [Prevotellaceae bacterium]